MTHESLVPIVLGHNAFFGVDHLDAQRGAARASAFADPGRILGMIDEARRRGAGGMMMSTHERAAPLCDLIRSDPELAGTLRIYPLLPYAQKYITRANEVGLVNVVLESLRGTSLSEKVSLIMGGMGLLTRDVNSVLSTLIRLELKPFRGLRLGAVFLHDALTDLALALDLKSVFAFYIEEISTHYGTQPAFATKNLPDLVRKFGEWELPAPTVLTHFNKVGFHMNPSREACEEAAREGQAEIMAMGTLASGFLRPDEAYDYLGAIEAIRSVVVGVSSPAHVDETFAAIKRKMPQAAYPRIETEAAPQQQPDLRIA